MKRTLIVAAGALLMAGCSSSGPAPEATDDARGGMTTEQVLGMMREDSRLAAAVPDDVLTTASEESCDELRADPAAGAVPGVKYWMDSGYEADEAGSMTLYGAMLACPDLVGQASDFSGN